MKNSMCVRAPRLWPNMSISNQPMSGRQTRGERFQTMTTLQKTSAAIVALCAAISTSAANPQLPLLNDPVDVSGDFRDFSNFYYLADRLADFDPATHAGKILYQRSQYSVRHAFDNDLAVISPAKPNEFPDNQYAANPELPFSIDFVDRKGTRLNSSHLGRSYAV